MKLSTHHFGEIEVDEKDVIGFKESLPGFDNKNKFIVIDNPDVENPFKWLQSVEEPSLAFVITNPFFFIDNYEFDIPKKVVTELELDTHEDVIIYSIAVIPDDIKNMTINLKAPIIINKKRNIAKQIVLQNEEYALKYKIFDNQDKVG